MSDTDPSDLDTSAPPRTPEPAPRPGLRSLQVLAAIAVLVTCWAARDLLVPLLLAMFLALVANPMVTRLHRWWVPRWLGALGVVLGGLASAVLLASLLVGPAADWVRQAPTELRQLAPKIKSLARQVEQANKAAASIAKAAGASAPVTTAVSDADKPHAPNLWSLIVGAPRILATILLVVLLSYFFLVYGETLQRQIIAQMPDPQKKNRAVDILRTIESDISRYVLTISVINVLLGLALTGALWWLGLDLADALLWGTVAALLNFIPYVGPLTGVLALALVGVVAFDQPLQMLLPPMLYLALHVLESQLITPIVLGRHMAISPLVVLLWLVLWGWLWGIAGLLLAVPMLACCKIFAERVDGWQHWAKAIE